MTASPAPSASPFKGFTFFPHLTVRNGFPAVSWAEHFADREVRQDVTSPPETNTAMKKGLNE